MQSAAIEGWKGQMKASHPSKDEIFHDRFL
jgi:hypothetical protein